MDFFDLLEIIVGLLFVFGPVLARALRTLQTRRQQEQHRQAEPTPSPDSYEEAYADYESQFGEEEAGEEEREEELEEGPWRPTAPLPPAAPPAPSWRYDMQEGATLGQDEGREAVGEEQIPAVEEEPERESYEQAVEQEAQARDWRTGQALAEERPFVSYEEEVPARPEAEAEVGAAERARAVRRTLEAFGVRRAYGLGPAELATAGFVRDAVILQVLLERPAPLGHGPALRNTRGRSL